MEILLLAGGLGFFLFGMYTLENGLKVLCGGRMNLMIKAACKTKLRGVVIGCAVTTALQSSSSVTVMLVGLAEAGALEAQMTYGLIAGANIGTSSTAWIIALSGSEAFNITSLYPICILLGSLVIILIKNNKAKAIGTLLSGFSLLLAGMESMTAAVLPAVNGRVFEGFTNPAAGFAAGIIITAMIQSSSASVGILQAVAASGMISFELAVPIVMGQNIGTCITAIISSIGCSKNAKKIALIHLSFNVVGAVICGALYFVIRSIINLNIPADPVSVALIHTAFNTVSTVPALALHGNKQATAF